jgi:hypothetical protein
MKPTIPLTPPRRAAWRHRGAREGFEVVVISQDSSGRRLQGTTTAVEGDHAWVVGYDIAVDEHWRTRTAEVWTDSRSGRERRRLEADGSGSWTVDGQEVHRLAGCLDVDLESSACTNTLPIHRLRLEVGARAQAPAAYVRVADLAVERLEQSYARVRGDGATDHYDYAAPRFDFECRLVYDESGLVLHYPGIAERVI